MSALMAEEGDTVCCPGPVQAGICTKLKRGKDFKPWAC